MTFYIRLYDQIPDETIEHSTLTGMAYSMGGAYSLSTLFFSLATYTLLYLSFFLLGLVKKAKPNADISAKNDEGEETKAGDLVKGPSGQVYAPSRPTSKRQASLDPSVAKSYSRQTTIEDSAGGLDLRLAP